MTRPSNSNNKLRESADLTKNNEESAADSSKTKNNKRESEFASKLQIANFSHSNNKNIGNIRESAVNQLVNQLTSSSEEVSVLGLLSRGYRNVAVVDAFHAVFKVEGDCVILEGTDEGLIEVWCRGSFVIRGEAHG